jgi:hypothetical protein
MDFEEASEALSLILSWVKATHFPALSAKAKI